MIRQRLNMQSYWLDGGMWDDQMYRISIEFFNGCYTG